MNNMIISGGVGDERLKFIKKTIDNLNETNLIIIYDATYSLVSYTHKNNVSYYCVDSVTSYIEKLKSIVDLKDNIYIFTDAYAGLLYSKNIKDLFISLMNKENVNVVFSARHLDFIPDDLKKYCSDNIALKEVITPLANTK